MRKFKGILLAFLVTSTVLISCSDDNTGTGNNNGSQEVADNQNATEENEIPVASLEEGVKINGATKLTGTPPAPTGNVDFNLNKTGKSAVQGSGFNIAFTSTANVGGAYVRFKDVNGNATSNYFDVPSTSFDYGFKTKSKKVGFLDAGSTKKQSSKTDLETQINVDFEKTVPAGEFCYEICLYDEANNISSIETICVTIEAWGGNSEIIGDWTLDRIEKGLDENTENIFCENGSEINVEYEKIIKRDIVISFNQDGSYKDIVNEESEEIDYDETVATCVATYKETKRQRRREGNWAYNEDDNEISIVIFKLFDLLDPTRNREYEFGDVFFGGLTIKSVTATQLIFEEFEEATGYRATYYFKR